MRKIGNSSANALWATLKSLFSRKSMRIRSAVNGRCRNNKCVKRQETLSHKSAGQARLSPDLGDPFFKCRVIQRAFEPIYRCILVHTYKYNLYFSNVSPQNRSLPARILS